jgi:DNA-binding winged helix-turn-helix (wHTH) protein/tetratricopeptide (TPR) repeat protein
MIAFPPFRLDPDEGRLWKGKTLLALRRKPFAILSYLATRPRKLVTHEELLAQVWRGAVVSDSAMRSHLHELRQVLGDGVIETVIGRGYRFVAELHDEVALELLPEAKVVDSMVVGRDRELGQLRAAFERALGGRRQLCFVTGEPGIGKSTLLRTFLAGLDPATVLVAQGACFEQHGAPEPYLALIDALAALARGGRGTQAVASLVRYAPTFVSQVPQLVSDEQLTEVSRRAAFGNEARQLRELSAALEAICSVQPLVLVIEDLQWSDVATIDLLSLLGQRQERAKLLVIGTSRHAEIQKPDHPLNHVMRTLVARSGALAVRLPTMDPATVQSFIDRRFAGHGFPSELTDLIAKSTGGTPLYVVSLLEELAGRGLLAEREGKWLLTVSLDELRAHRPASVKQLIDMQLDRLSAAEQRVLEAASVVGTEFATHLVAAALELSVEEVDDTCDSLARRALFLHAEPDGRYRVSHALVQEVCAERGSPVRRQRWHRLVAEALQRDPLAGDVSHLLAQHFDAAGDAARAIPAYAAAARQAGQRYASSDAVALCARSLALLPRLPASPERDLIELEVLETMCRQVNSNSFSALFAGRDPQAVYERAIALARSCGDVSRVYAAITRFCNYHMIVSQYARSTELTAELERLEQEHELDPTQLHGGIFARGYIAFYRGDLATALRAFERLAPSVAEPSVFHGNLPGRALALGHLACARWVVGDPQRALEEALAALELANQLEIPILQALGHVVRARLRYLRRDPLPIVEREAEPAVAAAALDFGLHTEASAFALWAKARRGALPLSAIAPMLDTLHQRLKEVSTCSTLVALTLIDVLRHSGHAAEARQLTDEIIAFARAHDENVYLPELLRVRGEQLEATDAPSALRDYRDAVELARSTGASSLEQRAAESLAALTRNQGQAQSREPAERTPAAVK